MSGIEEGESRGREQGQSCSDGQQQPRGGEQGSGGEDRLRAALPTLSYMPGQKRRWSLLGKFQQEQGSGQPMLGRSWRMLVPACTEQARLSQHEQGQKLPGCGGLSPPHTGAHFAVLSVPHSQEGKGRW